MRDDFSFEDLDCSLSSLTANASILSIHFPHFRRIAKKNSETFMVKKPSMEFLNGVRMVFEWFLTLSQRCLLRLLLFQSKSRSGNTFRDSLTGGPFCSYSMVLSVFRIGGPFPGTRVTSKHSDFGSRPNTI